MRRRFDSPTQMPVCTELQQDQGGSARKHQQKEKPTRILTGLLFDGPKKKRKEKTSQTARRADQSGEHPEVGALFSGFFD